MAEVLRTDESRLLTRRRIGAIRLPSALILAVLIAGATGVQAALALQSPAPWIVPDELIYSEYAKSIGDGMIPRIRDQVVLAYGFGYPALLAPIWAVFDDVHTAYAAAKVFNAFILSLTAVPAYLLAKRFTDRGRSLVVAGLTVSVPSMVFAGTLMTEAALYPTFVLALLAMTAALERPALATQAGALGAIALVCSVKIIGLTLLAGYIASILTFHWLDTRARGPLHCRLKAYTITWATLTACLALAVLVSLTTSLGIAGILGAYSVVLQNIDPRAAPWWALIHLAEIDLYVAIVPFAASALVVWRGLRRESTSDERLYAALTIPVVSTLIVVVAAFASTPHPGGDEYVETVVRLQERTTFLLVPIFFVGLAIFVGREQPVLRTVAMIAGAAVLPLIIPLDTFDANLRFQAPGLLPWVQLSDTVDWPVSGAYFGFLCALAFILAFRRRAQIGVWLLPVCVVFFVTTWSAHESRRSASEWTDAISIGPTKDWIDRAAGGRSVSVVWAEPPGTNFVELAPRHRVLFTSEFFNRRVGDVYEVGSPMPYRLPSTKVRLDGDRIVLDDGRPAPLGEFVLVPCHVRLIGETIVEDRATGARVVRVANPPRAKVASPDSCEAELWAR